jgi:hypothetical protein
MNTKKLIGGLLGVVGLIGVALLVYAAVINCSTLAAGIVRARILSPLAAIS